MEISHASATVIFSVCVSIVFALTTKETAKECLQYAIFLFFSFLGVALALGWVMYPFPK
jgi:hypothetical protein